MTAVRELIFAGIETALDGAAEEVERMPSGDPSAWPALHIFDDGDRLVEGETSTDRWDLSLGIDGYVEGGSGAEAHAAINALYATVIERLYADHVLAGLVTEIQAEGVRFLVAERASKRRLAFSLDLTINYATRRGRPQITN